MTLKTLSSKPKAKSPLLQLQDSLAPSLRSHTFKRIKGYLRRVGLEELDLQLTTRQQQEVLEQIEAQLVDNFPNVFSGRRSTERLQYARQAIVRQHGADRNKHGYAKKRTGNAEKDPKDDSQSEDEIIDITMLDDSEEESKPYSRPNASQYRTLRGKSQTVTTVGPRSRCTLSTSTSTSSAPGQCLSSHDVNIGQNGLSQVHYFLQSCSPPLAHLLSRFVDLGFKSSGILGEVACHWSRDERLELLKKLQASRDSRHEGVSELELIALERRFRRYYLEISNGM